MSTWAQVEDVEGRYEGPIPGALQAKLQTKLDDAEAIVIGKTGPIQAMIDAERTTPELVKIVLCDMVLRWLRNPGGVTQETAGPFGYSKDASHAAGRLYLSKDDRERLGLRKGAASLQLDDDALEYPTRRPGRPSGPWPIANSYPPGYDPDLDSY